MNRQERRQNRRRIEELTARADGLRAKLLENETKLAENAKLDDSGKSFGEKYDNPEFYEFLVNARWRGVETPDQAREELLQEVARRSVGKSDLALLLSSIDHTAYRLYATIPESLKPLHGEELVKAIDEHLLGEEFDKTLTGDPRWAEMRKRWVKLGWRGATEETFNTTFVRVAAERTAEINDAQGEDAVGRGFAILDTILDDRIDRAAPWLREKMMNAFAERLNREWNLILKQRGQAEMEFTLDGKTAKRLDRIADRWGTTREGAVHRVIQQEIDEIKRTHPNVKATLTPPEKRSTEPFSDHALMRRGRQLWELSYAKEMSDEELRDRIDSLNLNSFADDIALFAAKWAVHAFQRLTTSHTFAAALMCSDVQQEVLVGIEKQWDAFMVIVPNGMLISGGFEFSRILVATYSFGARIILLTIGGPAIAARVTGTISDEKPTLSELLVSDGTDLDEDAVSQRCMVMAKRLVAGLLLNLQHPPNFNIKKVEARPKSKGREAEPEHRIVSIGKPLEIDCRSSVKEYIEHGPRHGRKHSPPTVQVMVRGHYRRQVCGVGRMERKVIWIEPFWRGPEAALIQTRAKEVSK